MLAKQAIEFSTSIDHHAYMQLALIQAKKAFDENEVPVGAIVVHNKKVIAQAYNQVEKMQDPTAHAEMLCISQASRILGNWRLQNCYLYSTLEPCSMCAGAILLSRIPFLIWGAPDIRHGACGSWVNLFEQSNPHPCHIVSITSNIYKEECACMMKTFFKKQRIKKTEHCLALDRD